MTPTSMVKAGFEISSVGAILSYWYAYWLGHIHYIPAVMACLATTASFVYYTLQAYYLYKNKGQ